MIYIELFLSFFQIGLFSIGGGYAAMPLIEQQVVILNGWLSPENFADVVTIAEMTPGPIALNAATFVGNQVAGFGGALVATIGVVVPSTAIVFLMSFLYYRYKKLTAVESILWGLRPAIIALIASAGVTLIRMAVYGDTKLTDNYMKPDVLAIVIIIGAFVCIRKWKLKPIYVMAGSGLVYFMLNVIHMF